MYNFLGISFSVLLFACSGINHQPIKTDKSYTIVVYNIENLFDADGIAEFNDYKPEVYTPGHVYTKISNAVSLLANYNDGNGPDVLILSEIESDRSQINGPNQYSTRTFLDEYQSTTLHRMLGEDFNAVIADIPAEFLLLKGFVDAGIMDYDVISAYDPLQNNLPTHVQKNVILSRLPIDHQKSRSHTLEQARPILEAWIDVDGHPLVVFANHWKSGASNAEIEIIRVQNAGVLKARLDELRSSNPNIDFILGGDFNSDYNQNHRYPYMKVTGVNDILKSTGDEALVANGGTDAVYNLWYEYPIDQRGSDTFRGYWGTLMQFMVSPGLYDFEGIQYIDNSFDVLRIPDVNIYSTSGAPIRWSAFSVGYGYSDHLPISMKITVSNQKDAGNVLASQSYSTTDDVLWRPIQVQVQLPKAGEYVDLSSVSGSLKTQDYFGKLIKVEGILAETNKITVSDELFDLYSPVVDVREVFKGKVGEKIHFYGRVGLFRGNWQFVIESEEYFLPE